MNKKKLLSLVLSFALVFTTVFAGAGSAFAGSKADQDTELETAVLEIEYSKLRTKASGVAEAEPLNVKTMLYSNYSAPEYFGWDLEANQYVLTSVTPKNSGLMYMDYVAEGSSSDSVTIYLIESCEMTEEGLSWNYYSNYTTYVYGGSEKSTNYSPIPVTKGTKYQFLIVSGSYNSGVIGIDARAKVYTTGTRTISQGTSGGKYAVVSGKDQEGNYAATYFKITPTKTGLMTVALKNYGYDYTNGQVTLLTSGKSARSEKVSVIDGKAKFGVKKGTTYYLKVENCYGSGSEYYRYGVKYYVTAATDRSIGSKSKAKSIYRKGDTVKTLFVAANANSVDYYKMKVTKARSSKVTVDATDIYSGYVTMKLYTSKGKLVKSLKIPANHYGYITSTNLAKGTYYVKVTKSKKASGRYTVKWNY